MCCPCGVLFTWQLSFGGVVSSVLVYYCSKDTFIVTVRCFSTLPYISIIYLAKRPFTWQYQLHTCTYCPWLPRLAVRFQYIPVFRVLLDGIIHGCWTCWFVIVHLILRFSTVWWQLITGDLVSSSLGCSYSQFCLPQVGLPWRAWSLSFTIFF